MANSSTTYAIDLPSEQLSFDVEAFDELIRGQGVTFVHWRSMRCPVGLIDQFDQRRPHDDHSGCSNGFIYTKAGLVTCLFMGNSKDSQNNEVGLLDHSECRSTVPRYYDNTNTPVHIAPFDRLYLGNEDISVTNWQLVEHNISGKDKLAFPPVEVQDLIDSKGVRYVQGTHFDLTNGFIVWRMGEAPGVDPETSKGKIYSVRYIYQPFFYVKSLLHELRVSQSENPYTGERVVQKMPQTVALQREYVGLKEENDSEAVNGMSMRQVQMPTSGSFGPR